MMNVADMGVYDTDYVVNLYKDNGTFVRQVDVFNTYREAYEYDESVPVPNGHYYSIWCIEYNRHGEELRSFPMY